MSYLKVHFDGRVLVPEEPVNLPLDQSFEVIVPDLVGVRAGAGKAVSSDLPRFSVPPDAEPLRSEQVYDAQARERIVVIPR